MSGIRRVSRHAARVDPIAVPDNRRSMSRSNQNRHEQVKGVLPNVELPAAPLVPATGTTPVSEARQAWSELLPESKLCKHLESKLSILFKDKPTGLVVREFYSSQKNFFSDGDENSLKGSLIRCGQVFSVKGFDYRYRMIALIQKQEDTEVLFYVVSVKEFPESKMATLDYLDSVFFFNPYSSGVTKSEIYDEVINAYYEYAAMIGYEYGHIWVSAPEPGETYFFNVRPSEMKTPDQKQLCQRYENILEKGKTRSIESLGNTCPFEIIRSKSLGENVKKFLFSGFWLKSFAEYLEDEDIDTLDINKVKDEVELDSKMGHNQLIYIELKKAETIVEDKEDSITCDVSKSRSGWLQFLQRHDLEFDTLEKAKEATQKIVEYLLTNIQITENKEN